MHKYLQETVLIFPPRMVLVMPCFRPRRKLVCIYQVPGTFYVYTWYIRTEIVKPEICAVRPTNLRDLFVCVCFFGVSDLERIPPSAHTSYSSIFCHSPPMCIASRASRSESCELLRYPVQVSYWSSLLLSLAPSRRVFNARQLIEQAVVTGVSPSISPPPPPVPPFVFFPF